MHEQRERHQRQRDDADAMRLAGGQHRPPVAPRQAELVMRQERERGGVAHAASTCSATSVRKVSSRLEWPLPAFVRNSSSVPCGDQPAAGDHADAVGHALGDFEDMRGHDDGAAGRDALAQHVLDLPRRAGVEAGQRLVEDDQPRLVHQRAGERHLLPHALGEALAALVGVRREAEPADQFVRRALRRACGSMPQRPATNSRYSKGVSLS